jgi:DNA anti-recombination protein RmuC
MQNADAALTRALELTGQLDQRLLTTVYWCLGTVVAVLVVLVGYNWFVNFRTNQRESALLREEIAATLAASKNELGAKIQADAEAFEQNISQKVRDAQQEVRAELQGFVRRELASFKSALAELQLIALANETDDWLRQGVHLNALRSHMAYLRQVKELGAGWKVEQGLDKLEEILKGFKKSNSPKPDAGVLRAITAFLKEIEAENPIVVASLQERLKEVRE